MTSATNAKHDWQEDYVNEHHIQQFAEALRMDDIADDSGAASPSAPLSPGGPRVRKISAMSDFAPISVRVKRSRQRGTRKPVDQGQEWVYTILRWPMLSFIFTFIFFVFGAYVGIRQCVNAWERLFAWRGKKRRLRRIMRESTTYEEWKASAQRLDEHLGFNEWKGEAQSPYYDWPLIQKVVKSLKATRLSGDTHRLMTLLSTCAKSNFAGTESARLYSETFLGSKDVVEAYIGEVEAAFAHVRTSETVTVEEKRLFYKNCNINFGSSALCLSGGASFGYYHFGIVRALLDADLIPRVVAGTSAGGLIAALVCTRTDEELKSIIFPGLSQRMTACSEPFQKWFRRFRKTGARFDTVDWARKCCYFTRGSLTFREAWLRTGRVLNISVVPFDQHSPTKLLNYLTAPDTVIWTALLASAAVPGILNPVVLMQKTRSGCLVPWSWGSRFKDGSLRVDIPLQALNLYFNVTHPVVSQVNPHVHLFFFAPRGSAGKPVAHARGKGWRGGFLLSAAEQWLKLELTKNFKFIRDLELLPQLLGQDWSSVFLQRFEGAVTIWPRTRFKDWLRILSDPSKDELARMIHVGQLATWPKIHMIENRMKLEREIIKGRQSVRKATRLNAESKDVRQPLPGKDGRTFLKPPDALPIESEAEQEFAEGSQRFFKRPRGSSRTNLLRGAIGQSSAVENKQNSTNLQFPRSQEANSDEDAETEAKQAATALLPSATNENGSNMFLRAWRTRSFPAIPSPFRSRQSLVRGNSGTDGQTWQSDDYWSSDSSSGMEFDG